VQFAAAGLLLATRHDRWTWFLLGVLPWTWVDVAPSYNENTHTFFGDAWELLITGGLLAIAAHVCLIVVVVQDHANGLRLDPVRVATAAPLAALALTTALLLAPLLYRSWGHDTADGGTLRAIAGVVCAAAIPAAVIAARPDRAATFLPIGWLLGGAELAVTVTVNLSRNGTIDANRAKMTTLWVLLVVTAAAAIAARAVLNRWRPTLTTPVPPRRS
jgi:hypothetical protein